MLLFIWKFYYFFIKSLFFYYFFFVYYFLILSKCVENYINYYTRNLGILLDINWTQIIVGNMII